MRPVGLQGEVRLVPGERRTPVVRLFGDSPRESQPGTPGQLGGATYWPRALAPGDVQGRSEEPMILLHYDGALWGADPLGSWEGVAKAFAASGISSLGELRGSFVGVVEDRRDNSVVLFADAIRSRNLYYAFDNEARLLFDTDFFRIVRRLRECGGGIVMDRVASRYLLTFGYMLDDRTHVEGVFRVGPGSAVSIRRGMLTIERYWAFSYDEFNSEMTATEAVAGFEDVFSTAVRSTFQYDRECGRQHLLTLSGGLDSRAVAAVSVEQGFSPTLAITCSTSGYLDQTIAARVSRRLGIDNVFFSLDGGRYLKDVDAAVVANAGLVFFTGSAHMLALVNQLSLSDFGLLHTGMIGDGVMGSFLHASHQTRSNPLQGANSRQFEGLAQELSRPIWETFPTDELFALNTRGFNAVLNGFHSVQHRVLAESPFLDRDVVQFALGIPAPLRYSVTGAGVYRDWHLQLHGSVARMQWERTGFPLRVPAVIANLGTRQRGLRRRLLGHYASESMAPMDYWLATNSAIGLAWDHYFNLNVHLLDDDPELRTMAETLYSSGRASEKGQVLTLLAIRRLLGV